MEILTALIAGILGVVILSWFLLAPLTHKQKKEIRQKTNEELDTEIFRYEKDYFAFIGEEKPEVKEYKDLIERRDFASIRKNWRRLSGAFVGLERQAGHKGRPLIMDYYLWYELSLKEMQKRRT